MAHALLLYKQTLETSLVALYTYTHTHTLFTIVNSDKVTDQCFVSILNAQSVLQVSYFVLSMSLSSNFEAVILFFHVFFFIYLCIYVSS